MQGLQVVTVGVRGVKVPDGLVPGTLNGAELRGARLDDTTVVVLIPRGVTGDRDLRLMIGGVTFSTTLTITAAPAVTAPEAVLDSVVKLIDGQALAIERRLADPLQSAARGDTAGMRRLIVHLRARAAQVRQEFARLSAADRADAAAYLVANRAGSPSMSLVENVHAAPASGNAQQDEAFALSTQKSVQNAGVSAYTKVLACSRSVSIIAGVSALIGYGFGNFPGAAVGALAGGALGVGLCVFDLTDAVYAAFSSSVNANLFDVSGAPQVRSITQTATYASPTFIVGTPQRVVARATLRPVTQADTTDGEVIVQIARLIGDVNRAWDDMMRVAGLEIASPLTKINSVESIRTIPGTYLRVVSVSLPGATATTTGSDTMWSVAFENAKQGRDHDITFTVGFTSPGKREQTRSVAAVLQPRTYAVATVRPTLDSIVLEKGQVQVLGAVVRDSNAILLNSATDGRKLQWSSSQPATVSVHPVTGQVSALDTGTVTVTVLATGARGDTARATVRVRVKAPPSSITYRLRTANGQPLPYPASPVSSSGEYSDYIRGGFYTFNTDGTYSMRFEYSVYSQPQNRPVEWISAAIVLSGRYTEQGGVVTMTLAGQPSPEIVPFLTLRTFADGSATTAIQFNRAFGGSDVALVYSRE